MPLLRTETLFGIKCSIYDNGTVIAGTSSDRITLRLKANEELVPNEASSRADQAWLQDRG